MGAENRLQLSAAISCTVLLLLTGSAASQDYYLVKKVPLGGVESWDYSGVDPATHRIFLPRHKYTQVLDAEGREIGRIPHPAGWDHAVAFAPELNRGFLSDAFGSLTIFDLATLKVLQAFPFPIAIPTTSFTIP